MNTINHFLEMIAKEVKVTLGTLCSERMSLDDQLLPHKASAYYQFVSSLGFIYFIYFILFYFIIIFFFFGGGGGGGGEGESASQIKIT